MPIKNKKISIAIDIVLKLIIFGSLWVFLAAASWSRLFGNWYPAPYAFRVFGPMSIMIASGIIGLVAFMAFRKVRKNDQ